MSEEDSRLFVLHTNDIHSHLEAAAQIARRVKRFRKRVPADRLLVVDCGDFIDRARMETEGTSGAVNRRLLQEIGYDAVTLGNNEGLTYTYEQLNDYYQILSIPVVCANIRPCGQRRRPEWLLPSMILRKAGMNIGLIGLTAPFEAYYQLLGWHADDPIAAADREVQRLRGQADMIVVLSHLGLSQDELLASRVAGIDLILGAHTHHLLEKPLHVGRTAISAAGKFGRYMGELQLRKPDDRQDDAERRIAVGGGCLPTASWAADAACSGLIAAGHAEAKRSMSRVVAVLDEPLAWSASEESPLGALLATAVRRRTGASIGLVNAGQLLSGLHEGEITAEEIHAICPSPINCCRMVLTGKELLQAAEESLLPEFIQFEFRGFGFRGNLLGTLCYDGLELEIDPGRRPYDKVVRALVNGEPLAPEQEYEVGTLDMFTFGVGYVGLKEGRDVHYLLPEFIRELLCEALADPALIADSHRRRIFAASRPNA